MRRTPKTSRVVTGGAFHHAIGTVNKPRGCDGPCGGRTLNWKLDYLGKEVLESRLPGILEPSRNFAHVDPVKELIPVIPTCHYMMGGIPIEVTGQARRP